MIRPSKSSDSSSTPQASGTSTYENSIHPIAEFSNMEEFWSVYGHLKRPYDMPSNSDYHLFREHVKPVWEDPLNENGGKWMIRLRKGLASRLWEHLLIAIIADELGVGEEICGAVLSIRHHEDIISIWTRTTDNEVVKNKIRDGFKKVLSIPPQMVIEFKAHNQSMRDNSSYRNTFKL